MQSKEAEKQKLKSKSKVKLAPIHFNQELHEKTLDYWNLSRCWNGITHKPQLTISDAIQLTNGILNSINPERPLAMHVAVIKHNIIMHGSKRKMLQSEPANQNQSGQFIVI